MHHSYPCKIPNSSPNSSPSMWLAGLKAAHSSPSRAFPNRGSSQAHQPCHSSRFPLEIRSRTHPASREAGIPNLPGLLFSMYNEDYGLIPASQGGAVGIARVKALRQHRSEALTNPSAEGLTETPTAARSSHQLPLTGRQFSPQFRLNSSSSCWPYPENSRAGATIGAELPFKTGWCTEV